MSRTGRSSQGEPRSTLRVLQGLEEHRRHRVGPLGHDGALDGVRAGLGAERSSSAATSAPNGDRNRLVLATCTAPGMTGSNWCAQRGQSRDGEGAQGGAVVGEVAGDHLGPLGLSDGLEVGAGELPRRLDGFGPAGGEEHPVEITGSELGQPGRQLDGRRVRRRPDRVVGELLGLASPRFGEVGPAVAGLHDEQARQSVEVRAAVDVVEAGSRSPGEDGDLAVLVCPQPGEVHPQVTSGRGLEPVGIGDHGAPQA